MAVVRAVGFELTDDNDLGATASWGLYARFYNGSYWVSSGNFSVEGADYARHGIGSCLKMTGSGCLELAGFGGLPRVIVGCGRWIKTNGTGEMALVDFWNYNNRHAGVHVVNKNILIYDGGNVLVGHGTHEFSEQTWHWVEVDFTVGGSGTGWLECRIDGVIHWSGTGNFISAVPGTSAIIDEIRFGGTFTGPISMGWPTAVDYHLLDDVVIMDATGTYMNSFIGDLKVLEVAPVADGFYSDFTPFEGTDNYAMVNESPVDWSTGGSNSYNSADTVGNKDTFTYGGAVITNALTSVRALGISVEGKKLDSLPHGLKVVARRSATDSYGDNESAYDVEFLWRQSFLYVDPVTGSPFTVAQANDVELGYQLAS